MLKLKDLRAENNLLQKDIAKIVNKSNVCVGDWERGRVEPSIEDLIKLADYFQVSVDYLLGRTDEFDTIQNEKKTEINTDEINLLKYYRGINEVQQRAILRTAESFYNDEKQNKKSIS